MARAPMPAPAMIETPAMKRSAALAKALEDLRSAPQQIGGYGDLGARLLAQGITKWGADKADRRVKEEGAQRLAGQTEAGNLALARLLGGAGEAPPAAPPPPPMVPPVTNTQQPVEAMTAPTAPIATSPMPPATPAGAPAAPVPMADVLPAPVPQAAPAPQMAPQAPPQAPANPLGVTPGEADLIRRALGSGDPGQVAWAQGVISEIEGRMSAPPDFKDVSVNGVPYLRDQFGNTRETFQGGLPTGAMNQNASVGAENPYGVAEGTGISLDPFNRPQIVGRPPEGYTRDPSGGLSPEAGGREDLGGNPVARFTAITGEQQRLRPVLDQATSISRNIQALRAGYRAQNGSGDNAMINGLQRLTDDGVVREGDVALQLRMQGLEGGISGLVGYLRSDGTFSPEIRDQLARLGEDIFSTQMPMIREQVMGRRDFLERSLGAGAFDDVVPPSLRQSYGWEEAPAPDAPRPERRPQPRPRPSASRPASSAPRRLRYNADTGEIE